MRALTGTLTTAQQAASQTPYIYLRFRSRDRATTRTYTTADSPNLIALVNEAESLYGGKLAIASEADTLTAIVRLKDTDGALADLEWRGYRCDLGWGYVTTSGNEYSLTGPLFVLNRRSFSSEGQLYLELHLASLWDMLALTWQNLGTLTPLNKNADMSVRHILMQLVGVPLSTVDGVVKGTVVLYNFDTGVYTSYATEAGSVALNDVPLLRAAPAVGDDTYFGFVDKYDCLTIDLTTPGVGTWSIAWEYWNGASWTTLFTASGSGINTFQATSGAGQVQVVDIDQPTNWVAENRNSIDAAFPNVSLYYLRARVTSFSSITTQPLATMLVANQDYGLALDSAAADQGDDFAPVIQTSYRDSLVAVILKLIERYTQFGVFCRQDGLHLKHIDNTLTTPDYTYDTVHAFLTDMFQKAVVMPNRVVYMSSPPGTTVAFSYTEDDADSIARVGLIPRAVVDESVSSTDVAQTLARRYMERLRAERNQGSIVVPLNCGQEVWDLVEVQDNRLDVPPGVTYRGRVTQLTKLYHPLTSRYTLQITMGGAEHEVVTIDEQQAMLLFEPLSYTQPTRRSVSLRDLRVGGLTSPDIDIHGISADRITSLIGALPVLRGGGGQLTQTFTGAVHTPVLGSGSYP